MKLYAISGLGADQRVFQYLTLNAEFIPIDWITPEKNEPLEHYAMRLSNVIDRSGLFGILGVSFGGLVATEISKQLKPKITILISSAETRDELAWFYRISGKLNLLRFLPERLFRPPMWLINWLFGTKKKELLKKIIHDTDLGFAKWAVQELIRWKNRQRLEHCLKISGANDRMMPPAKSDNTVLIPGGTHFMIVDRAREISDLINKKIEQRTTDNRP